MLRPLQDVCFPFSHLGFKLGVVACALLHDLGFCFEGVRTQGCRVMGVSLFTSTCVRAEQVQTWVFNFCLAFKIFLSRGVVVSIPSASIIGLLKDIQGELGKPSAQ